MEVPHIYYQIRPLSPTTPITSTSVEHVTRVSGRYKGLNRNEDERPRLRSHLHDHHRPNSGSGGHRSRSTHALSTAAECGSSEKASDRPLPAVYALRPLPPPPSPPKYHFGCLLRNNLLPMPPSLDAKSNFADSRNVDLAASKTSLSTGDVKVILCVKMPNVLSNADTGATSCVSIDPRRRQVTLVHPTPSHRRFGLMAPKMFTFDAVFTQTDHLADVCSASLTNAVHSVVHGTDSCVLCFGHAKTSKSRTMLGSDASVTTIGVIPCAIAWLFRLVDEQKETTKTRFSVRISAVEVYGRDEFFKDLLQDSAPIGEDGHLSGPSPSSYLRDTSPNSQTRAMPSTTKESGSTPAARLSQAMDKLTEVRAPTAGDAAHLLDVALANRAQNEAISHTLITLHVYHYKVEKSRSETEVSGGRSRLQLLYLGCGRYSSKKVGQGQDKNSAMKSPSLANLANVLLGLLTGQRQLPHRESAVTQLLREGMTGNHTQPCIIAHASGQQQHYSETLQVIQLASRLHRLRRRRVGSSGSSTGGTNRIIVGSTASDSSTSSRGFPSRFSMRPRLGRSSFGTSTTDCTSSSEQSCAGDTVIYLGGGGSEAESTLGPRGTADGSVVHSADEWKICTSSTEEGTLQRSSIGGRTRLSLSMSQSEGGGRPGGLIKRITPRTNATAWPRAAAVRKGKEVVNSTEETWVDGPKAMLVKKRQDAFNDAPSSPRSDSAPPPAPPYFGFNHRIIPEGPAQRLTTPQVFVVQSESISKVTAHEETNTKEPVYASIEGVKGCMIGDGRVSESCTSSTSSSDGEVNENEPMSASKDFEGSVNGVEDMDGAGEGSVGQGGRGFGVLSDISERTEETEGGTSAPSSIAGGGQDERENTILDLAIQKSNLVHEDFNEIVGDEQPFSWFVTDNLPEAPPISFSRSPYTTSQLERKNNAQQIPTSSTVDGLANSVHQHGGQPSAARGKSTSMEPFATQMKTFQTSVSCSERSRNSPRRKKQSATATSFDRVAAWVKDVSNDLGHVQDQKHSPKLPSHSHSAGHRSCGSRCHRSHRKTRQNRQHHHRHRHRYRESTCSKCAPDMCALCEAADKCYCRVCQRCAYCDEGHISDRRHTSEPSKRGSSDNSSPKRKIATKPPSPPLEKPLQRHHTTQKALSASPVPAVIQQTVPFPWLPTQMSKSLTTHSLSCQSPISTQAFWSPICVPQPLPRQLTPIQYYPWSSPNSSYLQSSIQPWSTHLPLPSSAASDLSQIAAPFQCTNKLQRSSSMQVDTPMHTSPSTSAPPVQDTKKSKFFTLPFILCTLLRWRTHKKDRRNKKTPDVVSAKEGTVTERAAEGSELVMNIPLRTSASLPGAYSKIGFPPAPNSDQGLGHTTEGYLRYPPIVPSMQQPIYHPTSESYAGDPSAFRNQMHQSLSTYRTRSSRSRGTEHKDNRGSSGYESCRQGVTGGSGDCGGGAGGSSDVSSAHTDSVDSCSSGYHQHFHYPQRQHGAYCPNQFLLPSNQSSLSSITRKPAANSSLQQYPRP